MKVGIAYHDNDFTEAINDFMQLFILPTFVEREAGHHITHLTSSMIVELFNTHLCHIQRLNWWKRGSWDDAPLLKEYLTITEEHIYWDDEIKRDDSFPDWEHAHDDYDCFVWTDGRVVWPMSYKAEKELTKEQD